MSSCTKFQENAWKKEMCSNCLRPKAEHTNIPYNKSMMTEVPRKPPRIAERSLSIQGRPKTRAPPPPAPSSEQNKSSHVSQNGIKQNGRSPETRRRVVPSSPKKSTLQSSATKTVGKRPEIPKGKPNIGLKKNISTSPAKSSNVLNKNSILDALRNNNTSVSNGIGSKTINPLGISYNKPKPKPKENAQQVVKKYVAYDTPKIGAMVDSDGHIYSADGDYGTPCSVHLSNASDSTDSYQTPTNSREVTPDRKPLSVNGSKPTKVTGRALTEQRHSKVPIENYSVKKDSKHELARAYKVIDVAPSDEVLPYTIIDVSATFPDSEPDPIASPPDIPKSPPPADKLIAKVSRSPKQRQFSDNKGRKRPKDLQTKCSADSQFTPGRDSKIMHNIVYSPSMDLMDDINETLKDMGYDCVKNENGKEGEGIKENGNKSEGKMPRPKPRIKQKPPEQSATKPHPGHFDSTQYQKPIDSIPLDESKNPYKDDESLYSAPWDQNKVLTKAEHQYKKYLRNSKNISHEALNLELTMDKKEVKEKKSVQFDRVIEVAEVREDGSFKRNVAVRRSTGMTAAFEAKLANIEGGLSASGSKKKLIRPTIAAPPPPANGSVSPTKSKSQKPPVLRTKSDSAFMYGALLPPGGKIKSKEGSPASDGKKSPTPPKDSLESPPPETKGGKSKKSKGLFSFMNFLGKGKNGKEAVSNPEIGSNGVADIENVTVPEDVDVDVDEDKIFKGAITESDSTLSFDVIAAIEKSQEDSFVSDGSDADDICGKEDNSTEENTINVITQKIENETKQTDIEKKRDRQSNYKEEWTIGKEAIQEGPETESQKEKDKSDLIKDLNKLVAMRQQSEDTKLEVTEEASLSHISTSDSVSHETESVENETIPVGGVITIEAIYGTEEKSPKGGAGKRHSILARFGDIRKSGRRKSDPRPKKDKERKNSKIDKKDIQIISAEPMCSAGSAGSVSPEISDTREACDIRLPMKKKNAKRQQNVKSVTEATLEASRVRMEELGMSKEERSLSVSEGLKDAFQEGMEPNSNHDSTQDLPTPPPIPTHGHNAYEFVSPITKAKRKQKSSQSGNDNSENLYDVILSKAEIEKQRQWEQSCFPDTSNLSGSSTGSSHSSKVEEYLEPINASSRRKPRKPTPRAVSGNESPLAKKSTSSTEDENPLHISEPDVLPPNTSSDIKPAPAITLTVPKANKMLRLLVNTPANKLFEAHNGGIHSSKEPYVLMYRSESRQDKSAKIEDAFDRIVGMNRISMEQITSHFKRSQESSNQELPDTLKWSDFELTDPDPICIACDALFYRATYQANKENKEYILMITEKSIPQLEQSKRCQNLFHFIGLFQDVVSPPVMALLHDGKSHYESTQAHVGVLSYNSIQTLEEYFQMIGELYKSNTQSLERVICSAFLQLVQGLTFLLETNLQCGKLTAEYVFIVSYGEENSMLTLSPLYLLTTQPRVMDGKELSKTFRELLSLLGNENDFNVKFSQNAKRLMKILDLLSLENGNCLPKAKELLDFLLWGPSERCVRVLMEDDVEDHEHTFRMWLEIQSARKLNDLVLKMITYNKTYKLTWEESSHIKFLHDAPIPQLLDSARAIYDS